MAYKSFSLLALFTLASLLSTSIPSEVVIGDKQLDPKVPKVVEIANFAMKEHNNEAKTALQFRRAVKAWERVDLDSLTGYYHLQIATTDSSVANPKIYHALVASGPIDKSLRLISFES